MKVRVTLVTENDKHIDAPIEQVESMVKGAWEIFCRVASGKGEAATVESIEVIEQ